MHRRRLLAALVLVTTASLTTSAAAVPGPRTPATPPADQSAPTPLTGIIPAPAQARPGGSPFTLTPRTAVHVSAARHASGDALGVARYLTGLLRPATGYALPVSARGSARGSIELRLGGAGTGSLGTEGYRLTSGPSGVTIAAARSAGLFHGVQTLRQLLPAAVEKHSPQRVRWTVAGGTVTDTPRYGYRSSMLDVSRHFLKVAQVKRYIDEIALYKMNTLHLHLSDDQGWRIAIDSWPRLATYGGSTEVGGGAGGYYTKAEYRDIVRYAASRYVRIVPEIDMPSHINAALASYPQLNCDGVAPPLYTGTAVGFSSACVSKKVTYDFVDDVLREIAAMTPGPYLHIGGDEAHSTSHDDYVAFMDKVQPLVGRYGKTVVGWHQLTEAHPVKGAVAQYWGYDATSAAERQQVVDAAKAGTRLVISPADRSYLDMKYTKDTPLGLQWAGLVSVQRSYDWDPGTYLAGAPASSVLGVEAPLWTETLSTDPQLDYMAFPRLPGIAELGWSPRSTHDWNAYRQRLAAQGPRWDALGIGYFHSPEVPWPSA